MQPGHWVPGCTTNLFQTGFRTRAAEFIRWHQRTIMSQVELNAPAPDFTLPDYRGEVVSLSQFQGQQHVLLVFNRGFS